MIDNKNHKRDLFSIILFTFNRPHFLREAVNALFRQTYDNIEIIIINNAATEETVKYLYEIEALDKRIKLVHFKENQYDPKDPHRTVHICFNAALKIATGDYIFYQSDDDLIADNYVEKMVNLFQENSECTTAAGLYISIDINGKVLPGPRISNFRQRYVKGNVLALDSLRGGKMFSAPGCIFAMKRDLFIKAGGFHRAIEYSCLIGVVPFGITGFDETAILYWRRHEGQLNKQLTKEGWIGIKEDFNFLREWKIQSRWEQAFNKEIANQVIHLFKKQICECAAMWFSINLFSLQLRGCLRMLGDIWNYPSFWLKLPRHLFITCYKKMRLLLHYLKVAIVK